MNSTHGKIGRGRTFFFEAFGRNLEEFQDLLFIPEAFIIKRWDAEINGFKERWRMAREALTADERKVADKIVKKNVFDEHEIAAQPDRVAEFLSHYLICREDIPEASAQDKADYIAEFEASCTTELSDICRELLACD